MHLHVKIVPEIKDVSCAKCGTDGPSLVLHLFVGTGNEITEPMCQPCINDTAVVDVFVLQADMTPERRAPGKKARKMSRAQERRVAEDLGGRRQPGSGNQDHAKGDVRVKGKFRIEAKYTQSKQYTLKRTELDKISGECGPGETPVFHVDFRNSATGKVEDSWVAIPYDDWKGLIDAPGDDK